VSYSPHLRTAILLSGNGTGGAYHAGVLRAMHEAGVKIDVVGARGVGVVCALFAAIDASPRTWEDGGVWRGRPSLRMYRWRSSLQWSAALAVAGVAAIAIPLLMLAAGAIAYPLSFLVQMINVDSGYRLASGYADMVRYAFAPGMLPTLVPRLTMLCLAAAFGVLAVSAVRQRREHADGQGCEGHRMRARWWARLVGPPWTVEPGLKHVRACLWQLFQGPTTAREPTACELSRRYTELLFENLGQPGFRELIIATVDLETRADIVFAAVGASWRPTFFQRARGDVIDLAGIGRNHVLDAISAAVSLPLLTEPHYIAFSPESYWKGETHRSCDRIGAVSRLLDELLAVGVDQVIVVCADPERVAPHRLSQPHGSLRAQVGEQLAAEECTTVRDAVVSRKKRFKGIFVIQPSHNPVGPLDFEGTYDDRSDRYQSVSELIDRGYEDAYKQFIDPVIGGG
jgi:hypothetical protein